jgi:hypothetical protein
MNRLAGYALAFALGSAARELVVRQTSFDGQAEAQVVGRIGNPSSRTRQSKVDRPLEVGGTTMPTTYGPFPRSQARGER